MNGYHRFMGGLTVATTLTILAMMLQSFIPAAGLVSLVGLLVLPGTLALQIIRPKRATPIEKTLFAACLSLLVLMVSGFVSNQLVYAFGNAHPLSTAVQVPWMIMVLALLLCGAWWRNRDRKFGLIVPNFSYKQAAIAGSMLTLPALAALGADSLNNGGSNLLTMICYGLIAVLAIGLVAFYKKVQTWVWTWAIFCIGLAMLWSTSLRGMFITGHDIQLEYYVYRLTEASQHWTMANLQDAYNACLSITILPTILKSLTGFDAIFLYKVVYQIIFGLCAAGILALSRRLYPSSAVAFVSALVFVTFPTYVTDMPFLNRQEVAFLFFVAMLLALFNQSFSNWTRRWLLILFGTGIVLSHYSTTFVTVGVLMGAYVLLGLWRVITDAKGKKAKLSPWVTRISLTLVMSMAVATFVWTGLYTKTGGNIAQTIGQVATSLPTILSTQTASDSSQYTILKTKVQTPQELLNSYSEMQHMAALPTAAAQGGLIAGNATYTLQPVAEPTLPITKLGDFAEKFKIPASAFATIGKEAYALGLQAAIFLGLVVALVYRKKFNINPDFVALAPAGIMLLGLQAVMPIINYGLYRMLQQDLIFLALPVVLGLLKLMGWLKLGTNRVRLTIITTIFAISFLILSGFVGVLFGGSNGQLPLSNSGFYYDAYYTNNQDIGTFSWLQANYPKGYPINSDTFTRMKIMANTGITTVDGLTPDELTAKSYVVLAGANVTGDRVVALYINGQLMYYKYPTDFLNSHKDLVFSTNSTRVYH